jgi:AcrR family transcriptional regulator
MRLEDAVCELATRDGYSRLTVDGVRSSAGVSRATFYQYFANVEDCFWSAYRRRAERLIERAGAAAAGGADARVAILDTLVATAITDRATAELLMSEECLGVSSRGVLERDALVAGLQALIKGRTRPTYAVDLPDPVLIGATFRFLSMALSDGSLDSTTAVDLRSWVMLFCREGGLRGSGGFIPDGLIEGTVAVVPVEARKPHGTARERILSATEVTIAERGYRATTVAGIVRAAGVSRRAFYDEFASKIQAVVTALERGVQELLTACTVAFFGPGSWPERVWATGDAFARALASDPAFSRLALVEGYALGPGFRRRVYQTLRAFSLFLEEGYRQPRSGRPPPSRVCSTLTAVAVMELCFLAGRNNVSSNIRQVQPLGVYIALTPFIDADAAAELVRRKLGRARRPENTPVVDV